MGRDVAVISVVCVMWGCRVFTEVAFHHSAGDTICSEFGLVLESHSIDETSEWRTFANESRDNDPVRVGGPTNSLLTDGGLSTVISKPNDVTSDFLSSSLGRWQNRGSNHDRSLILAFKTIATMSDRSTTFAPSPPSIEEVEEAGSYSNTNQRCYGFGTFGFNIHHRYSDPVKGILDLRGLPEKGSLDYYAAMAHRDLLFHGRKLAAVTSAPLTFLGGNDTYQLNALGHLFYANVSVGSPSLWFLVALDTGSDLFWLPCDCTQCVRGLKATSGQVIDFNIYSPSNSTRSTKVSCNSTFCGQCSSTRNTCAYQVEYLSNNTSSSGLLVEDVLHLTTDDSQLKVVDAQITFGCGMVQTGSFLDGAAPNGLFGLGMNNISVPSILANQGLAANSFSMCFGPDGIGRISFGDKGSSEQGETPFNLGQSHPTYNISITQITVEKNVTDLGFTAIFDSGTSFTYLNDPAYSVITEGFNSQAKEKRHPPDSQIPFEYCYDLSANQTTFETASLNLTMKGGKQFPVTHPIEIIYMQGQGYLYCLAVVKSGDINIIGQNFMTGYRIIFDRERMVLGWESTNCYDANNSSTLPVNPRNSGAVTPTTTVEPEATSSSTNGSPLPSPDIPPPASSDSPHLNSYTYILHVVVILSLFIHGFVILSS